MKPKTMLLMVIAGACGLGASYLTSQLLAERGETPPVEKVTILVAKKNLNMGEILRNPQDVFETKSVTAGEEPKGAIDSFEQLQGRQLALSLRAGDHIRPEDLLDGKNGGIWRNLPEGHRAVGIRVNIETSAYGFASLPHSRVDIISTVRRGDDRTSHSQVLLHDVLVLAADERTNTSEGGKAVPATVVTVAVTPKDMLKLNLAKEHGPLSLALRRFDDRQKAEIEKLTWEEVLNGASRLSDEPGSIAKQPSNIDSSQAVVVAKENHTQHRVRLISGNQVTYHGYRYDERGNLIEPQLPKND